MLNTAYIDRFLRSSSLTEEKDMAGGGGVGSITKTKNHNREYIGNRSRLHMSKELLLWGECSRGSGKNSQVWYSLSRVWGNK